jgi:Zn-finger nucleic acid-binding protein
MKSCPNCRVALERATYEGVAVETCPACGGHLVVQRRLEGIKRNPSTPTEQLKAEATGFAGSTSGRVTCPACFSEMKKERPRGPVEIELDVCPSCGAVWLDPGELAMIQLAHELSTQSKDAEEFKQRHRELEADPERKARFERNLARMREGQESYLDAIGEGLAEGVRASIRRRLVGYRGR